MGNMEGPSLFETLENLTETVEAIKSDLRQREITAHTIRASTLDEWAGINSDPTDRNGFVMAAIS